MNVCNANNLSACGEPPISFSSEDMCEKGSLSVLFVILFFSIIFASKQVLYRQRGYKESNGSKKVNGIMNDSSGSIMGVIGHHVEEIFIKPFVPTSLENMVATIYFCYFFLTITMGVSRFYEKHWANDPVAQQGPFNLLSWAFGCESVGVAGLVYTPKMPDLLKTDDGKRQGLFQFIKTRLATAPPNDSRKTIEKNYFESIDWLFTLHLLMGTAWLTIGFLQIVSARTGWSIDKDIRRAAHRMFGRFAMVSFILHMGVASLMALRNPVKQALPIVVFYWIDIADNWIQAAMGVAWAIEAKRLRDAKEQEDGASSSVDQDEEYQSAKNMHEFRMVTVYLRSTFGSGAIRFTVWLLWLLGKFFSFETRILIDRGECQAFAQVLGSDMMGQADMCLKPVFLNLAATDVFVVWLEWLFVCILAQEKKRLTAVDANTTKIKLFGYVIAGFAYVATLRSDSSLASYAIIFYALCTKLRVIHDHVAHFILNLNHYGCEIQHPNKSKRMDRASITIDGADFRGMMGDMDSDFPGLDASESSYDADYLEVHPHED